MLKIYPYKTTLQKEIQFVHTNAIQKGFSVVLLEKIYRKNFECERFKKSTLTKAAVLTLVFSAVIVNVMNNFLSIRCLIPNNFIVWEITRPLANCSYCVNVLEPITLLNVTRPDFKEYMYSSKPLVIKTAIKQWRAINEFSFQMLKQLHDKTSGSYDLFDEGCQFLNFKTDLFTLKDVFSMPEARANNQPGQEPWYVGWANCHPDILRVLRQYYDVPHFFPIDAEYPATENIFFGYAAGAVMHLDYIPRLMWQGQVKGSKKWSIAPVSECDHICHKLEYNVEAGDIVLLDTRIWYHATSIPKGEFSVTVQSEYG